MRVLVVVPDLGLNHVLLYCIDSSEVDRIEYQVTALTQENGAMKQQLLERGTPLTLLALEQVNLGTPRSVIRAVGALRWQMTSGCFDVIESVCIMPGLVAELCRATCRNPPPSVFVRHHNAQNHLLIPRRFGKRALFVGMDRWVGNRATTVVVPTRATRETAVSEGISPEKVHVINYGFDWESIVVDRAARAREWKLELGGDPLLVAVGRIDVEKDYMTLARAFSRVRSRHPNARLAIAGAGVQHKLDAFLATAKEYLVDDAIELLGWVDDVYDLISAADVFCQSSLEESFGQSIAEAIGLGVPIAVTTPEAVLEIVGPNYPHIAPGDARGLADRAMWCLDHPEEARADARTRCEWIRCAFPAERQATHYHELIRSVRRRRTPT